MAILYKNKISQKLKHIFLTFESNVYSSFYESVFYYTNFMKITLFLFNKFYSGRNEFDMCGVLTNL